MRVLFIEEFFYPHTGGVGIHILNLAKRLADHGVSCATLVPRRSGDLARHEVHNGVEIHRCDSVFAAMRFLKRHRSDFDIVHAHTSRRPRTAICMVTAKRLGFPVVFTPHAYYPAKSTLNGFLKTLFDVSLGRWSIHAADMVINLTEVDRADGLARGQAEARSTIIPNSVNYEEIVPYQGAGGFREKYGLGPYILSVGRIHQIKNLEWLVRALPSTRPDLGLVVIGPDDGDEERLKRLAIDLNVADRILWAGRVGFDDLMSAYQDCEAFVLPSLHEGLPTVVLEAMAFARPAIASSKGGTRQLISEGETGFYCDGPPETLNSILERLAIDNADNRMGKAAQKLVETEYSWAVNALRIHEVYAAAIGDGSPAECRPAA